MAAALGAIAGGMAASKLPSDKFIWTGFALAPLLILLEVFFKHFVALFGGTQTPHVSRLPAPSCSGFMAPGSLSADSPSTLDNMTPGTCIERTVTGKPVSAARVKR